MVIPKETLLIMTRKGCLVYDVSRNRKLEQNLISLDLFAEIVKRNYSFKLIYFERGSRWNRP